MFGNTLRMLVNESRGALQETGSVHMSTCMSEFDRGESRNSNLGPQSVSA